MGATLSQYGVLASEASAAYAQRHVSRLFYTRLRERKGHRQAMGAVARHLAEATFYALSRQQPYPDPALKAGCTTEV